MKTEIIYQFTKAELEELATKLSENIVKEFKSEPVDHTVHYISIDEAAEFLKMAKSSIYGMVHQKRIPHNKVGKKLYFSKVELTDWIATGRKNTVADLEQKANQYLFHSKMRGI